MLLPELQTGKLPSDPETLASTIFSFLQRLTLYPNPPYVHPKVISFPTSAFKANWAHSLPDIAYRDTYPVWRRAPKQSKNCQVGFFSTWTRTWVGDVDWDSRGWHAWAVAILRAKKGLEKYMIIWDCDPRCPYELDGKLSSDPVTKRPHQFLLSTQDKLLKFLRRRERVQIKALFYNTDSTFSSHNRCLEYTLRWIRKLVEYGDAAFEGFGENGESLDPRTEGCNLIPQL